jgi:hypothetical protein
VRLRTPSDDEGEVVGPAKVKEGVKEEGKMDIGDAVKKEEYDWATKKEDANVMQKTCTHAKWQKNMGRAAAEIRARVASLENNGR